MPAQYEAQSLWHWNKLDIELNGIWEKRTLKLLGINETFVFFFFWGGGCWGAGEGQGGRGGNYVQSREKVPRSRGNGAKEGILDGINKGINRAPFLFLQQRETERETLVYQQRAFTPPPFLFFPFLPRSELKTDYRLLIDSSTISPLPA